MTTSQLFTGYITCIMASSKVRTTQRYHSFYVYIPPLTDPRVYPPARVACLSAVTSEGQPVESKASSRAVITDFSPEK